MPIDVRFPLALNPSGNIYPCGLIANSVFNGLSRVACFSDPLFTLVHADPFPT